MDDTPTGPAPRLLVVRDEGAARQRAADGIDLILLDCRESPIDGVDCMQCFAEALPGIPGLVIAGADAAAPANPAIVTELFDRIVAPVEPSEILARVEQTLRAPVEPLRLRTGDSESLIRALAEARVPLAEVSKGLIEETLELTGGNRAEAARRLGVSERTIYNKVKRFGLELT